MRLYLIRHAQSANNALLDQRQRVYEPELTDLGVQQAACLAEYLATQPEMPTGVFGNERYANDQQYRFTHLYCSPMIRAMETARPIAQALGLEPSVWTSIHEIGGLFLEDEEGKSTGFAGPSRQQLLERFPGYTLPDEILDSGWWKVEAGRETTADYMARGVKLAIALRDRAQTEDRIALVMHGAFMDILIKALLNQLPGKPFDMFYAHYNTAITRFDFADGMDGMRLHYLNRVEHLAHDIRTW
jgi:2,3-bisphosphoglycerate-dependent phosphoglycerate mutase